MYHNPIKQSSSFYTLIKLIYVLLTIPFLSLTHAVSNVRYSVNYKHQQALLLVSMYLIVILCFVFSSHSFWTSSSLDVPAGVTQEEGHTGFLIHLLSAARALIFIARRMQPFLSLVNREVEFCVLTIY